MKRFLFFASLVLCSIQASAQFGTRKFKPFKIVTSLGYARPESIAREYALDFQAEPKYGINDYCWVTLRTEAVLFVQKTLLSDDYKALAVYAVTPGFDFSLPVNETFRPFVSFSAGWYTSKMYYDGSEAVADNPFRTHFGFCPRIGFDYKNFTISAEQNFVGHGLNYFAVKAGFCLWGGTVD